MFHSALTTPFCRSIGITYPVLQAGMGFVARGELAAAVSDWRQAVSMQSLPSAIRVVVRRDGEVEIGACAMGQSAAVITEFKSAGEVVLEIMEEASRALARVTLWGVS